MLSKRRVEDTSLICSKLNPWQLSTYDLLLSGKVVVLLVLVCSDI